MTIGIPIEIKDDEFRVGRLLEAAPCFAHRLKSFDQRFL